MKKNFLILGTGLLLFGLTNLLSYLPISLGVALMNRPFPFEHLHNVIPSIGKGTHIEIGYMPIDEAINDPYWLAWSMSLYAGIIVIGFAVWKK